MVATWSGTLARKASGPKFYAQAQVPYDGTNHAPDILINYSLDRPQHMLHCMACVTGP